jgi:NADPH-dependent 2,4-dienoyl-CoA reductase/sulfur reductase-like enzyme
VRYRRNGAWHDRDADLLLVHDGVIPNTWLAMSAGCEHFWHAGQQCWHPRLQSGGVSSHARVSIAGDAGGIVGSDLAAIRARIVALHVAHSLGAVARTELEEAQNAARSVTRKLLLLRQFLDRYYGPADWLQLPENDDAIVCRCEEVTVAQIKAVAALGCTGPNQGKAFTRCGMGPCMGRECGVTVSRLLGDYHKLGMPEVGYFRIRPPVKPITVGQLADLGGDDGSL